MWADQLERSVSATALGSIARIPSAHGTDHLSVFPLRSATASEATDYQPDKKIADYGHSYRQPHDHSHRLGRGPHKKIWSAHKNANDTSQCGATE